MAKCEIVLFNKLASGGIEEKQPQIHLIYYPGLRDQKAGLRHLNNVVIVV